MCPVCTWETSLETALVTGSYSLSLLDVDELI